MSWSGPAALSFAIVVASLIGATFALVGTGEDRVKGAYERAEKRVRKMVEVAGVTFPPKRIYLRAFKHERKLEVWGSNSVSEPFKLIHTYQIAMMSGKLGPKRREGDLQVPEGLYRIDRFNPKSQFHLSLGIDYPNASDRKRSDPAKPGGDIFIHGSNRSIGCLAMTDPKIEEIYLLALEAKRKGQSKIPVHVFPFRQTAANQSRHSAAYPEHAGFWNELKPFYDHFERTKQLPSFKVDSGGRYTTE